MASCIRSESNKTNLDLKYLTCSPSVANPCLNQNQEQEGFLEELIQKGTVLAKDGTPLEFCQGKLFLVNCCHELKVKVLASDSSWKKCSNLTEKSEPWCSSCRLGAPQKSVVILSSENRWKKYSMWKKSGSKFLKGKCFSFRKALVEKKVKLWAAVRVRNFIDHESRANYNKFSYKLLV